MEGHGPLNLLHEYFLEMRKQYNTWDDYKAKIIKSGPPTDQDDPLYFANKDFYTFITNLTTDVTKDDEFTEYAAWLPYPITPGNTYWEAFSRVQESLTGFPNHRGRSFVYLNISETDDVYMTMVGELPVVYQDLLAFLEKIPPEKQNEQHIDLAGLIDEDEEAFKSNALAQFLHKYEGITPFGNIKPKVRDESGFLFFKWLARQFVARRQKKEPVLNDPENDRDLIDDTNIATLASHIEGPKDTEGHIRVNGPKDPDPPEDRKLLPSQKIKLRNQAVAELNASTEDVMREYDIKTRRKKLADNAKLSALAELRQKTAQRQAKTPDQPQSLLDAYLPVDGDRYDIVASTFSDPTCKGCNNPLANDRYISITRGHNNVAEIYDLCQDCAPQDNPDYMLWKSKFMGRFTRPTMFTLQRIQKIRQNDPQAFVEREFHRLDFISDYLDRYDKEQKRGLAALIRSMDTSKEEGARKVVKGKTVEEVDERDKDEVERDIQERKELRKLKTEILYSVSTEYPEDRNTVVVDHQLRLRILTELEKDVYLRKIGSKHVYVAEGGAGVGSESKIRLMMALVRFIRKTNRDNVFPLENEFIILKKIHLGLHNPNDPHHISSTNYKNNVLQKPNASLDDVRDDLNIYISIILSNLDLHDGTPLGSERSGIMLDKMLRYCGEDYFTAFERNRDIVERLYYQIFVDKTTVPYIDKKITLFADANEKANAIIDARKRVTKALGTLPTFPSVCIHEKEMKEGVDKYKAKLEDVFTLVGDMLEYYVLPYYNMDDKAVYKNSLDEMEENRHSDFELPKERIDRYLVPPTRETFGAEDDSRSDSIVFNNADNTMKIFESKMAKRDFHDCNIGNFDGVERKMRELVHYKQHLAYPTIKTSLEDATKRVADAEINLVKANEEAVAAIPPKLFANVKRTQKEADQAKADYVKALKVYQQDRKSTANENAAKAAKARSAKADKAATDAANAADDAIPSEKQAVLNAELVKTNAEKRLSDLQKRVAYLDEKLATKTLDEEKQGEYKAMDAPKYLFVVVKELISLLNHRVESVDRKIRPIYRKYRDIVRRACWIKDAYNRDRTPIVTNADIAEFLIEDKDARDITFLTDEWFGAIDNIVLKKMAPFKALKMAWAFNIYDELITIHSNLLNEINIREVLNYDLSRDSFEELYKNTLKTITSSDFDVLVDSPELKGVLYTISSPSMVQLLWTRFTEETITLKFPINYDDGVYIYRKSRELMKTDTLYAKTERLFSARIAQQRIYIDDNPDYSILRNLAVSSAIFAWDLPLQRLEGKALFEKILEIVKTRIKQQNKKTLPEMKIPSNAVALIQKIIDDESLHNGVTYNKIAQYASSLNREEVAFLRDNSAIVSLMARKVNTMDIFKSERSSNFTDTVFELYTSTKHEDLGTMIDDFWEGMDGLVGIPPDDYAKIRLQVQNLKNSPTLTPYALVKFVFFNVPERFTFRPEKPELDQAYLGHIKTGTNESQNKIMCMMHLEEVGGMTWDNLKAEMQKTWTPVDPNSVNVDYPRFSGVVEFDSIDGLEACDIIYAAQSSPLSGKNDVSEDTMNKIPPEKISYQDYLKLPLNLQSQYKILNTNMEITNYFKNPNASGHKKVRVKVSKLINYMDERNTIDGHKINLLGTYDLKTIKEKYYDVAMKIVWDDLFGNELAIEDFKTKLYRLSKIYSELENINDIPAVAIDQYTDIVTRCVNEDLIKWSAIDFLYVNFQYLKRRNYKTLRKYTIEKKHLRGLTVDEINKLFVRFVKPDDKTFQKAVAGKNSTKTLAELFSMFGNQYMYNLKQVFSVKPFYIKASEWNLRSSEAKKDKEREAMLERFVDDYQPPIIVDSGEDEDEDSSDLLDD